MGATYFDCHGRYCARPKSPECLLMSKRTLVLALDMQGGSDWQVNAMNRQMSDWITLNKTLLPIEDMIILPTSGETRLYWLEGKIDDDEDIKTLEQIKDRIKPILEIALGIKIDKEKLFKDPLKRHKKPQKPRIIL